MYTSEKFGHTYTFFIMIIFYTFLNNSRKCKSLHYEIAQVYQNCDVLGASLTALHTLDIISPNFMRCVLGWFYILLKSTYVGHFPCTMQGAKYLL